MLLIVTVALFLRVYELPPWFFNAESHAVFNGLRLHLLPLFNFSDHISENFFKSFFGGTSGIRFPLSTYVASTIYSWFGIPLNQYWIYFFYCSVGTLVVVGTYLLGCKLLDYRSGLIGAAIIAINSTQIDYSRSDGAQVTVSFIFMVCIYTLVHYKQHRTWFWRTVFSILLTLIASMETILTIPLILLYQLILFVPAESSYSKKAVGCFRYLYSKENILIWLPCFLTLLIHYYVYIRIGMSNIGMFGYMIMKSQNSYSSIDFLNSPAWDYRTYSYYFNKEFFFSSMAVLFFLLIRWRNIHFGEIFIFSGVGFFYHFFWFFLAGGSFYNTYIFACLNGLFLGSIWVTLFDNMHGKFWAKGKYLVISGLSIFLLIQAVNVFQIALRRQHLIHPLKSMGFYIQEYGGESPTVYLMQRCDNAQFLVTSEFFFGTQIIDMEYRGSPRKLFCMGSESIENTLSAYKLKDFDFYVAPYAHSYLTGEANGRTDPHINMRTPKMDSVILDLRNKGVKRVATIKDKGLLLGEIYSRLDLPFKDMEIDEYDNLWDKNFGNIAGVVKTIWSGQSSTWGTLWHTQTGIQYPSDPKTGKIQYPHLSKIDK